MINVAANRFVALCMKYYNLLEFKKVGCSILILFLLKSKMAVDRFQINELIELKIHLSEIYSSNGSYQKYNVFPICFELACDATGDKELYNF